MSSSTLTTPTDADIEKLNAVAVEVPIDEITIGERIRRDFSHVPDLAKSIEEDGLIQPIVLTYDKRLIAGESRLRAHKLLGRTTIRAVFRGVLDEAQLIVLETTENNARQNLTWQERCLSVDKVHRLRTANAMLSGESWGVRETGRLLNQGKSNVSLLTFIAEYLHKNDQEIWQAESATDAYRIITKRKENEVNAALAKITIPTMSSVKYAPKPRTDSSLPPELADNEFFTSINTFTPGISSPVVTDEIPGATTLSPSDGILRVPLGEMLVNADAVEFLKTVPNETYDHCITDWPYAIDLDNLNANNINGGLKDLDTVKKEHDVEDNLQLQRAIVPEIFRTLKQNAFFITWMDTMWWNDTYNLLTSAGFKCQRWPLIWHKTSSCMNQAAQTNFTKNFEIAIVARKGIPTLVIPQSSSIWMGGNDIESRTLGHPFAKPFGLWNWLFDAVTIRGQHVLEPFAGRGSAIIPMLRRGLCFTAVELQKEHYNALVVNVSNVYRSMDPKVEFV